jgi:hypothetical protein
MHEECCIKSWNLKREGASLDGWHVLYGIMRNCKIFGKEKYKCLTEDLHTLKKHEQHKISRIEKLCNRKAAQNTHCFHRPCQLQPSASRQIHLSNKFCLNLILFILVRHTSKLNYRIIVNTVQCDSICRYLLPLHVSVSWPSSEGIRSTCAGSTITNKKLFTIIWIKILLMSNIYGLEPIWSVSLCLFC